MEKIKNYFKENIMFILITFFFTLIILSSFIININSVRLFNNYKYLICFLMIAFCVFLHIFVYRMFKKNWTIEKIFLFIAIPLGLAYMIIVPIGRVPDELNHYYRAYDISRGNIFSKKIDKKSMGNIMPDNISDVINIGTKYYDESTNIKVKDSKTTKKANFSNTAIYAPIVYLPQAIGILIGNIFNAPILIKALLGRLCNYILFLVLMFYSIKLMPFKKYSVFAVLLLPILIQQSASLSADVFTNSISILFSAYVLNLIYNKKQKKKDQVLTFKQKMLLLAFVILIALSKFVYLPICLLLFLIPTNMFENKKEKYKYIIIACLIAFVVTVISVIPSLGLTINTDPNVNFAEQVKWVLTHLPMYIVILVRTLITMGAAYINNMTISVGALDVNIPLFYAYLLLAICISTFLSESHDFKKKETIIYGLIALLTFGLIMSVEYASWTPVANHIVEGMQGRYLFPVIIPIMLLFNFKNKKNINTNNYKCLVLSMVMINICILISLFYNYV